MQALQKSAALALRIEVRPFVNLRMGTSNISHKLLRPSQFLESFPEILQWSTLQKQIRPLPPTQCCSILTE